MLPLVLILTFLNSFLYGQTEYKDHKLNFGATGGLTFWPKPIVNRETGNVAFIPGIEQQFEYGIQLNYNIAKTWSVYANYLSGAAPIVTKQTFYAKDYPNLLEYNIVLGPPPRYVDKVFYWMIQIMGEKHFNPLKRNNISISAGVSIKENSPGSYSTAFGFEDSNKVGHHILTVDLQTGSSGKSAVWALNLGAAHYFNLVRQRDLKLMFYYSQSLANIAEGGYYIFAESEYQTTGTYKIRGHYIALNLTYLLGRNKKIKAIRESGE